MTLVEDFIYIKNNTKAYYWLENKNRIVIGFILFINT